MTPDSGILDGRCHRFTVRVYYEATDAGGLVYHADYLKYAERARTEMMRLLGMDHTRLLADHGLVFAVRKADCDFLAPARLDDVLTVVTTIDELGGASMRLTQEIRREATVACRIGLRLALLRGDGRPGRMPRDLHRAIARLISPDSSPNP